MTSASEPSAVPADANERAARNLLFAGTIIGLIGVTNVVQGIGVLSGSKVYPDNAVFVFAGDRLWGWVVLLAGIVAIVVSFAIYTRSPLARWLGVAIATGNAITQLLVMPARPLWALAFVAADLLVIRALVVYGETAPLAP
jgi:cytochrome b subunit of formate dehydrogenase